MADIDLHKEYNSSGESLQELFGRVEEGFFVPLYQREYTWEEGNINQLFEDLVLGTRELSKDDSTTTFLGTTILTDLTDRKRTVRAGDEHAQPTGVQIVIDGQQRISTLALMSIQIISKLRSLFDQFPDNSPYYDLHTVGQRYIDRLTKLHTIELATGAEPPQKPKIIRESDDSWTYTGNDDVYQSPVARYIATYIRTADADKALEQVNPDSGTRVRGNIELIDEWLEAVCNAHVPGSSSHGQFPIGQSITSPRMQEYILGFTNDDIKAIVEKAETDSTQDDYRAVASYQLLLLTYYLLRRCGVNRLQPTREEWGFDMFQSLNATGTPLTAMETFLPEVMQAEEKAGNTWTETPSCDSMGEIQRLFEVTTTNEQKNRRTNELLGTFALCYDGQKLANKFSEQRKWITRIYDQELDTINGKRDFLEKLAQTSNFFYFGWHMEEMAVADHINGLEEYPDRELVSLLIRYLRDASSRLSAPILSRFYSQAVDDESKVGEFIESVKACAAFFTLWRSANSTSGLDDIYRRYFKGAVAPVAIAGHNWTAHPDVVQSQRLKRYFRETLNNRGIGDRDAWIAASQRFLLYTELKTICRFVLFLAGHDRVADPAHPGLTVAGTNGSCTLLTLSRWVAKDHRSLEHVAPHAPPTSHTWDSEIYTDNLVHQIGNLMLLPIEVNKFVDNKSWAVKYLHYSHIGKRSQGELDALAQKARQDGIVLSKRAISTISKTEYNCAVEPIVSAGESLKWDAALIGDRTRQIKELAWEKLNSWLKP